jgi:hypothetical protein
MKTKRSDRQVAMDRQSARSIDEQGFLHVEGCNISKACVSPYWGSEIPDHKELGLDPDKTYYLFRDPDELEKSASTFNNLPLMDFHVEVSAEELEDEKVRGKIVGSTGTNAVFSHPYLQNTLVIWTAGAIHGVMSKEQTELSCAYRYELDMTPGEFEGVKYDARMKNIRGNHVALVDEGRAGPDVTVKDRRSDKLRVKVDIDGVAKMVADALRPILSDLETYQMPKKEAIAEHKRLVGVLKSDNHKDDAEEAELKSMMPEGSITIDAEQEPSITEEEDDENDTVSVEGENAYEKVNFADEVNRKYPLDTPEQVLSALREWGEMKNRNAYSKETQTDITSRINSAAQHFKVGDFAEGK